MKSIFLFILSLILISSLSGQSSYKVSISKEDGEVYSINYGSFFVKLLGAYKYPYGEDVILNYNGYSGEICWKENEYNYYSGEYSDKYSDCYSITESYVELSCFGCLSKGIGLDEIDSVLKPTKLSEILPK